MTPSSPPLLIEEVRLPAGGEWLVVTGAWHFARVQSGAAYWLGRGSRSLSERELIVLGPEVDGNVRASQIGEVILHAFNFMPELLAGFFTLAERHFFELAANGHFAVAQFFPTTHPAAELFADIVNEPTERQGLMRRAELLLLVVSIFNNEVVRRGRLPERCTSAEHRFRQLISRLPDSELIAHTPEHLARLCECSPRHFSRLFQRHFGASARERQSELRLLRASQLLAETTDKIAQIALNCGYRNVSLFNAMFKERFGMTPSAWRTMRNQQGASGDLDKSFRTSNGPS